MKTILVSMILFVAVNIHASQPFVLSETENEIIAKTSGYSLAIQKNPFQIKI
jgi:hypothetical protein